MRIDFNISQTEAGKFRTACEAVLRNVGNSSRAAVEYAGWDIMSESLGQVPIDTGALVSSAFLGVSERSDVVSYRYGAVLGYGQPEGLAGQLGLGSKTVTINDPGGVVEGAGGKVLKTIPGKQSVKIRTVAPIEWLMPPTNNVNPKSGLPASSYAAKVHEDLDVPHPNGGKAKFLEDPIRNWAAGKFARTAMTYWKQAITTTNLGHIHESYRRSTGRSHAPTWQKMPRIETHTTFKAVNTGVQRGGEYVRKGESE